MKCLSLHSTDRAKITGGIGHTSAENKEQKSLSSLYYVSIIPDRYGSVPIFISDRPSVFIGTYFFWHDFGNGEGLEPSDSEIDTRRIG